MIDSDSNDLSQLDANDQRHVKRLYDLHRDQIYSYCFYVCGNADTSSDVVHETFLRLMKQPAEPNNVRNWLFITARNLLFSSLKRSRRDRNVAAEQLPFSRSELSAEQQLLLEQMLNRLTAEERELLIRREYSGFSTQELAASLEITVEAVRVRLFRIRKKLRTAFEDTK